MPVTSAGILLYKRVDADIMVFLVHPGGPIFKSRDKGWWSIPKGLPNPGEELLPAARREFEEETGFAPQGEFIPLGHVKQKGGKTVHAWAVEGDLPASWVLQCNTFKMEWPPKSGSYQVYAEVDKAQFFTIADARECMNAAQSVFLTRLQEFIQP